MQLFTSHDLLMWFNFWCTALVTSKLRSNRGLLTDFLSQQNDRLFLFLSELLIYLWLAETSQQPISQTTWLKVTPHCNHCLLIWLTSKQFGKRRS